MRAPRAIGFIQHGARTCIWRCQPCVTIRQASRRGLIRVISHWS